MEWVVAHRAAAADRRAVGYKVVAAGHTVVVGHRVVAAGHTVVVGHRVVAGRVADHRDLDCMAVAVHAVVVRRVVAAVELVERAQAVRVQVA